MLNYLHYMIKEQKLTISYVHNPKAMSVWFWSMSVDQDTSNNKNLENAKEKNKPT